MNHPDPIIETRNKYNQTRNTLAAAREQRLALVAQAAALNESIIRLEVELSFAESAYTAAVSQQSIDTMRRALLESAKQHRQAGDRAHASMCDAAARLECSGYNVIEALCDCGGSGYTPSANDSGDEPCPYHATQEERRTIHRADPLDTFD